MRLWPRRKVIYTWDDNFAPALVSIPGPIAGRTFTWYSPDDAYIRLTCVAGKYEAMPGIRPGEAQRVYIYRGHIIRFQVDLMIGVSAPGTKHFSIFPTGMRYTAASSGFVKTNSLPSPCHMIPGDSFRIIQTGGLDTDYYFDMAISFDRWELK